LLLLFEKEEEVVEKRVNINMHLKLVLGIQVRV